MRPKLRTLLTDIFKDVSYVLDDDGYAQAEYNDVVRKRFIKSWENLLDGYKVGNIPDYDYWADGDAGLVYGGKLPALLQFGLGRAAQALGEIHDGL